MDRDDGLFPGGPLLAGTDSRPVQVFSYGIFCGCHMDEIWGAESETGWETVTVHIGRLRKRFEGWREFEIESVRGLGYKAVKKA